MTENSTRAASLVPSASRRGRLLKGFRPARLVLVAALLLAVPFLFDADSPVHAAAVSAAPLQQTATVVDICSRTLAVQTAILASVPGAMCSTITITQLASITGLLNVNNYSSTSVEPSEFAGLTGVEILLLTNNAIETLLPGAFEGLTSLEELHLTGNRIKTLEDGVFRGLTGLTNLWMPDNGISAIKPSAFTDLTSLESLQIFTNNITTLDAATFAGLTTLTNLAIGDNPISSLHVDTFDPLTSLERLDLSELSLTNSAWDEDLFDTLTNLTHLRFARNGITTLPVGIFGGLTNLEDLDINENAITALPDGIFDGLTGLKKLYLNHNALTTLPANVFDELTALQLLYLNNNSLSSLPTAAFAELTSGLTTLYLHRNSLPSLHVDVFDGLTGLTQLALSYNELTTVPEDLFDETTALQYLYLNNNMLSSVPENTFDGLTSLLWLYLSNNNLASLNVNLFDETAALQLLGLHNNTLAALDATIFDSLTALKTLYLHGNSLTTLDADIFDGLGNLGTLRLNDNGLTALSTALFEDLDDTLQQLVLTDNSISTLPAMVFAGLTGLKGLDLSCNGLTALDLSRFDPFASSLTYLDITGNSFTTAPIESAVRAKLTSVANLYISEANTECLSPYERGLSGLTVSVGMLEPAFEAPGFTGGYRVSVAYNYSSIVITPTTTDPHAAITSTPADIDLDTPGIQADLPTDRTRVSFTVTAENGVSTRAYVVEVFRDHPPSSDATLSGLVLTDANNTAVTAPAFAPSVESYAVTVTNAVSQIKVEPTKNDATATIQYLDGDDMALTDADGSIVDVFDVDLDEGANVIKVKVTAEDGTTMKTYIVTITREPATPPGAPASLTATPGDTEVDLLWTPPASNGGAAITKYQYRVRVDGGTDWAPDWTDVPDGSDTGTDQADERTVTVTGLANGIPHTFQVRAVNSEGDGSEAQDTATPATTPGAPASLTATPGDTEVDLLWTPPASNGGAAITKYQYRVRVDGGTDWAPDWTDVPDGSDTGTDQADERTVTVTGLANGIPHTFQVRAVNSEGDGSEAQDTATPATPPGAPASLTATPGDTEVDLLWTPPASNGGAAITKYQYRVRVDGGTDWAPDWTDVPDGSDTGTDQADERTVTVTGLANGIPHTFQVRAVNSEGDGSEAQDTATPATPPGAPASLTATPGDTEVDLLWTPPASNGGAAITKYQYRVRVDGGTDWAPDWTDVPDGSDTGTDQADERTVTVTGLANGIPHTFQVRAVNSEGDGSEAQDTATPATTPGAPASLTATPGDTEVDLLWTPPASNGGAAITKYQYRVRVDGGTDWAPDWTDVPDGSDTGTDQADERTVTVTGLANGTPHTFQVRAVNSEGDGSEAQDTATPATTPGAPASLTATPGDTEVDLLWTPPASNGGAAITKYQYRVRVDGGTDWAPDWTDVPDGSDTGTDQADERTVTVTGLANGIPHTFQVRAVNSEGDGSEAQDTATPATTPGAPASLTATPGDTEVDLLWTPPASNGGAAITKYQYRVRVDGGTDWAPDWTDVPDGSDTGTDQADERTVTVTGLANGTPHTFQVRAVNSEGDGSEAQDTATPATTPGAPASLTATPGDTEVDLLWTPPASNGGAAITKYQYRVRVDGGTDWAPDWTDVPDGSDTGTDQADERTVTVTGLANGIPHTFQVRAVNSEGDGSEAQATATVAPPPSSSGGFGAALTAPKFVDGFRTSRPLAVTAGVGDAVGDPVAATHPRDLAITYALSGADAALFTVDEETGQIRLGQAIPLALGQTYTVNLTATDSTGRGAIIIVVIEVVEAVFLEDAYHRYDLNRNSRIELDEALTAVGDYFRDVIGFDLAVEVVNLYFGIC